MKQEYPYRTFSKHLKVALDFDGTVVSHEFPFIGKEIGAVPVLKLMQKAGARLILDTMRSGDYLSDAVLYLKSNGIELYAVGKDKGQTGWTSSNKCHAEISIDDRNLGIPLLAERVVNWEAMMHLLFSFFIQNGITLNEFNSTLKEVKFEQTEFLNELNK